MLLMLINVTNFLSTFYILTNSALYNVALEIKIEHFDNFFSLIKDVYILVQYNFQ